jgi:hypothetical protein
MDTQKMKYLLSYFLLFFADVVCAQLLDNRSGKAFTDIPFFNTSFVKASKIRRMDGTYTFRKQGDVLRQSNYVYTYEFDQEGRIVSHLETAKGDLINDSTVRLYEYDNQGLACIRKSQQKGFITTIFTRDSIGRVLKEQVYRDIDTTHSLLNPVIERRLLWNEETMSYNDSCLNEKRKSVFNSYGSKYLESTIYFDSLGYISREEELYTITRNRMNHYYSYTDKGYLKGIKSIYNQDSIPQEEILFEYDQYGNMTLKSVFKNGVFTTEYAIIYSGVTGLLSSVIIREVSTNFLSIIRFKEATFY